MTATIEGVGFGIYGYEDDYLIFVDEQGQEQPLAASKIVPPDGRCAWRHYEALTGGFGDQSDRILAECDGEDRPIAYRLRITVEAEPLTREESDAVLARVKARRAAAAPELLAYVEHIKGAGKP